MVEETMNDKEVEEKKGNVPSKRRPFATGSKPGPDEIDHHLESKGFYRKHVARDASSLFRVVSEQVLDVQNYHDKVRQDLASFIEQNFKDYVQEVDKNIYNYCTLLRRLRTHGTLFDLKVMARMYKKNVILYEPTKNFQTTERFYVQNDDYDSECPMRVFYSEQDKHFDIIFTLEYTEELAESQGMVYEILYKDVFKLPDVGYAVERMLHDPDGVTTVVLFDDSCKYTNAAGDIIPFDSADDTNCVLKDPRTCHYHNQDDFQDVILEQKDLVTIINRSDDPGRLKIYKPIDGFLHEKDKSCVRQLLEEKITPFPYKVAKALDRSIYRNTEFELWSENRKDQRMKWLDSNGLPVRDSDDMFGNGFSGDKKTTHHQITRDALDEILNLNRTSDGKKRPFQYFLDGMSTLDDLKMGPIDQSFAVYPVQYSNHYKKFNNSGRRRGGFNQNYGQNRYDNYPNQQHNNNNYGQETNRDNLFHEQQEIQQPPIYGSQQPVEANGYQYVPYEQYSPSSYQAQTGGGGGGASTHYYVQPSSYPMQYTPVHHTPSFVPCANFSIPPPPIQQVIAPTPQAAISSSNESVNLIRDSELTSNVNQASVESTDPRGSDMPLNDIPTLQFFYNLGVRYFSQFGAGVRNRLEGVVNQLETLAINEHNRNEVGVKNDVPPPPPANTPVSSKPSLLMQGGVGNGKFAGNSSSNNRFQNGNHNRRAFSGQNREGRENNYRENNSNHRDGNWRDNRNRTGGGQQSNQGSSAVARKESVSTQNSSSSIATAPVQASQQQLTIQIPPQNVVQASPIAANGAIPITTGISPVAPAQYEGVEQGQGSWSQQQQQTQQSQPISVQYYPYQTSPNYVTQPPAQAAIYYYSENGELLGTSAQPQMQQVYYSYPQAPIYYQAAQQPQQTAYYDDSGHVDTSLQNYSAYPIYYQPPPVYYPPTPATATPHIMTTTPIFPVPVQNVQQAVVNASQVVAATNSTGEHAPEEPPKQDQNGSQTINPTAENKEQQEDAKPVQD